MGASDDGPMQRPPELANYRRIAERIVVPDLYGLDVTATLRKARAVGFLLSIGNLPIGIEDLMADGFWTVGEQDPPAGSERYGMDMVVIRLRPARGGGGDSHDREPRNPLPLHHGGHGVPETADR